MSVGKSPFDGPFATYHLLPHQNGTYDIGAPSQQFKNLYLSGNATIGGTLSFGSGGGVSAPVGGITEDVAVGLTAAGTVIGDALQLAATINRVDTAAAGTGVKLLGTLASGSLVVNMEI